MSYPRQGIKTLSRMNSHCRRLIVGIDRKPDRALRLVETQDFASPQVLSRNRPEARQGIKTLGGSLVLANGAIRNSQSNTSGGAIVTYGPLTISNSLLEGNRPTTAARPGPTCPGPAARPSIL